MVSSTDFILTIQANYNQFTKAEKKVADYVIKNRKQVLYMSITDLADACEVGDTSVYRFCRTMGLQGYQEFKMKMSLSLADASGNGRTFGRRQNLDDSFGKLAETVMEVNIRAIRETYMLLDRDNFDRTIEMMEHARRIYFFGVGDSLLTAEEARNKFLRITSKVVCITDPHMQAMAASLATAEDLVVLISYSGATKDNIQVAKNAGQTGARIVCISHFQKSPLTAYADAILLCGTDEGPLDGGSMAAKMSQLYLIYLLYQEYYARSEDLCGRNNELTSAAVLEKLY